MNCSKIINPKRNIRKRMNRRRIFLLALVVPTLIVMFIFNIIPGVTYLPAFF